MAAIADLPCGASGNFATPDNLNYERRIRIIAAKTERQMEKLYDLMSMTDVC